MADKDKPGEDDANLEMPSLGLGGLRRKRRKGAAAEEEAPPGPAEETPVAPELSGDPTPEPEPDPAPVEPVEARTPAHDPETIFDDTPDADDTAREDTTVLPADRPLFADEPAPVPAYAEQSEQAVRYDEGDHDDEGSEERERREFRLPAIAPMRAAMVTGLVIGLLAVGLTFVALRSCELVRGTSSCGGGPGFFLLLAILVVLVVLGGWLLRAWDVSDPMSTSFLAVGLVAVVALLFLVDVLFSPWMLLVVPLVAVGTFALSHWVTTAFIEPAERKDALRDVE